MRSDTTRVDRDERNADAALRGHFRDVPAPALSPFFAARVRARVREDGVRRIDARTRWLLRAYWVAAGVVALLLVSRTAWPATLPPEVRVAAIAFAVVVGVPVIVLGRLRGGVFELVLRLLR